MYNGLTSLGRIGIHPNSDQPIQRHTLGSNHLVFVKKRLFEHEVIKPKVHTKWLRTTETQKRKTQNPTPRSLLSLQNNPPYLEVTSTRGRRLRLAGVSICNRTVAVSRMWTSYIR
jgi:hypothetical protein